MTSHCWLCPDIFTGNSVDFLGYLELWYVVLLLISTFYMDVHEKWRDRSGILVFLSFFGAIWFDYSFYFHAYAGGKMWIQGTNHYVNLLCHLGSTDVDYIITRCFLLLMSAVRSPCYYSSFLLQCVRDIFCWKLVTILSILLICFKIFNFSKQEKIRNLVCIVFCIRYFSFEFLIFFGIVLPCLLYEQMNLMYVWNNRQKVLL